MVAARAVSAALDGVGEDAAAEGSVVDAGGDVQGVVERLAGFFVADKFDAEEQPCAANVADDGKFAKRLKGAQEFKACGRDASEKIFFGDVVEDGESRGGGNGMRGIGEAVEERAGAAFDGLGDFSGDKDGAERGVAAGDSLPYENDVGFDVPVIDGKVLSCAAHAGHDFVGDQKNAVAAADFGDAREIFGRRRDSAESGAGNGFDKKGGDVFGAKLADFFVEFVGARNAAGGIFEVQRAAVTVAGRDVMRFGQKRRERRAAFYVAGKRESAERSAVIALRAGDEF